MASTIDSTPSVCFLSLSAYGFFQEGAPHGGGAQRQLHLLSQELSDSYKISFIVGDYGQDKIEQRDGVTLYRAYEPSRDSDIRTDLSDGLTMLRTMRRFDPDVFIYRGYPRQGAVFHLFARILNTKFIYHVSNDADVTTRIESLSPPWSVLFNRTISSADRIIVQNEFQQRTLRRRFDTESRLIPNGYPPAEKFVPYDERAGVVWVGRLEPSQKRPHLFLDLAEDHPEVEFRLIGPRENGSEEYVEQLERRVRAMEHVTFVGAIRPKAVHGEFMEAIALVNTSAYEGFPNTFLEAWRYGTPVLSLDVNPGRYLGGGSPGFANHELRMLSTRLEHLLDNVDERARLGKSSRTYFEDNYTIEQVAKRYKCVIEDVLQ